MNIDDFDWTGSPFDPEVKASEGSDAAGSAAGNDFASFDWSGTPFEAEAPEQPSVLEGALASYKSLWGAVEAGAGAFTDDPEMIQSGLDYMDKQDEISSAASKGRIMTWDDWDTPGEFLEYIGNGLVGLVPYAAESATAAALGALAGGATGGPGGVAAGTIAGLTASTAVKAAAKQYAKGKLKDLAKKELQAIVKDDIKAYAKGELKDKAKRQIIEKSFKDARRKAGAKLGAVVSELKTGFGDVYSNMLEADQQEALKNPEVALAWAVPYAAVGSAPEWMGIERVFSGGGKDVVRRTANAAAIQVPAEGGSEMGQEEINIRVKGAYDPEYDVYGPEANAARIDSLVIGGVGGGAFGAATGAFAQDPDAGQHVRTAIDVDEAVQKAKEAASRGFEGPMMPTEGPPLPPNGPTLPPSKVLEQQALGGFVGDAVTMEPGVDIPQPVLDERNTRPTESSTLSGSKTLSLTDRELINELKRANDIPVEVDQKKNLAATKLDTAPNTQIQDQLVESAKRTLPDTLTPKRGFYASQGQAEHALRGKMQTTNEAKRAALGQFQAVESNPGQWVLQRKKAKELPAIPSDRTVTRAEVVSALNDSGLTSERQQAEVFDGLVESSPNVFKLADVQETLNRFDLKTPEGSPVVETGLQPAVQKAFPTGKVETLESGSVRVTLPNKTRVLVHPDQTIEVDSKSAKAGYGPKYKGQKKAAGSFQRVGLDGIMRLAKEADQETVDHEAFHVAWNVLTDKERSALERKHGSEEGAAKAYASWKPQQKNGIFEKIMRFFRRIRETLFGPTAKGAMERVAKGEVFERAPKPESKTSYDIKEKSQKKEEAKPEPRKEPQGEAEPQQAAEPKTQSEKGRIGQNLNLVTIQLEDETGATRPVRADVALADADQRIQMLEQLKECLS